MSDRNAVYESIGSANGYDIEVEHANGHLTRQIPSATIIDTNLYDKKKKLLYSTNVRCKSAWKYMSVLTVTLLFVAIICWEVRTCISFKEEMGVIETRLYVTTFQIDNLKISSTKKIPLIPLVAINLCGKDDLMINSTRGAPYTDWKETVRSGDIHYVNGTIHIKVSGIYHVYAQMYLYENDQSRAETFEFHIKKKNSKSVTLSTAIIPKESCKRYCTRYISRMVHLKANDRLFVTSYVLGVHFYMSCDQSQFGLYMLKKD